MAKNLRYYYLPDPLIDSTTRSQTGEVYRPKVPIRLSFGHGTITNHFDAVVDSGADRNLFPLKLGVLLGINFNKVKPRVIYGIGGLQVKAYSSQINIWLNGIKHITEADFCDGQYEVLLGRQGFFSLFKSITFSENNRYLEIEL